MIAVQRLFAFLDKVMPLPGLGLSPLRAALATFPWISTGAAEMALKKNADMGHVVRWDSWKGELRISSNELIPEWTLDIRSVDGLSSSKSDLTSYYCLDAMICDRRKGMVEPVTIEKMHENLSHKGIRILHQTNATDCFYCYLWDSRVFYCNTDGSHHLAAARYIAGQLQIPVPLRAGMRLFTIDPHAVDTLNRDSEMFVMSDDGDYPLLCDAMYNIGASYSLVSPPFPLHGYQILFLPRSNPKSMVVAALLKERGFEDFGAYLMTLTDRCKQNAEMLRLRQ